MAGQNIQDSLNSQFSHGGVTIMSHDAKDLEFYYKFLFQISGSALNFGLFLPPPTPWGSFCSCSGTQICWIIVKNLIAGAQKYPTQAIRTWWEVCLMWEKCWSLWEVWSLINTVRKGSLYDMVTNLLPQILFDAFNLAILIVFYLHTTQAMFKIDHSLRICDLLKSHLHM